MCDFTLVSYKMIRVDCSQFDKHYSFFHHVRLWLKTNRSDLSFAVHQFWKSNVQWNVLLRKENLFHKSMQRESKQLSPAKKVRRTTCFLFHICRYMKEMIMSHDSLLVKRTYLDIMNTFGILHRNEFVWLHMSYYFYGKWIICKNENNQCWCIIIVYFHYRRADDDDQTFN